MSNYKIIFSGPVGAGKTTAINAISDIDPITTDELGSDMALEQNPGTTLAMDYGVINLQESECIHLYGTRSQQHFGIKREILTQGGIGLVLLINNRRPNPFQDMHFFLNAFQDVIGQSKVAIGVTQMDLNDKPMIEDYHLQLENSDVKIPLFEVDARTKKDVALLVEALLYSLDPGLDD